jgi:hypothetical protein
MDIGDEICVETKISKKPCKYIIREIELQDLIHNDLGDLNHKITRGGKIFYEIFVDDLYKLTKLYLLITKNEAITMFITYKIKVENQKNKMIKILRTDKGGKYEYNPFKEFCEQNDMILEVR